ncbi:hypothetical protein Ahy_B03g061753 isoform E [Arachis hypogaea]|uniref:C-JID domain-containing protein n=1 Tax=Arachis hypogaea TaxID=3818 RepID=A0A444ZRW2_ARAHY|nr:hypothetical protein Ahy_B03g061753 isoform E [Arachis hypogaea]
MTTENGEIEKIVKRVRSKLGCNLLGVTDDVKAVQLEGSYEERNMTLRAETLSRMRRLEFLKIKKVSFSGSFNSISSELRYLEWEEYPFTYFSSCCKLSKLSKLVLQNSNIKQLWDGTMLENGSESSIQCQSTVWSTFKRLKLRLPFHFFNSSKSRYNRVFHLWRLSVARLSCVYYLDLSYCNLHTIPEAISSLHYLEFLYFTGNNIVRVPDFINKLPRLRVLELDNCKRLMYVDEFPLPLPLPYPAAERTKLVKWGEWRMLNCPKIVEKERLSGMGSSWMREYIKVHNESTGFLAIVIPGSGVPIPRWFKHQNKGADNSMWIESFPNANDNNWIGIALCAQIAVQLDRTISINLYFYDQTGKGNLVYSIFWPKKEEEVRGELVQLCLFYFSRQLLIQDGKQHDLDGSRFEFKVDYQSYVDNERLEVKKWGMPLFFHSNQTLTKLPVDSAGVQHPCSIFLLLLLLLSLYAAMLFEYEAWWSLSLFLYLPPLDVISKLRLRNETEKRECDIVNSVRQESIIYVVAIINYPWKTNFFGNIVDLVQVKQLQTLHKIF